MFPLTEMLLRNTDERRVVVGARQSGRTTALIVSAILTATQNRNRLIAFVCPTHAMMQYAIRSAQTLLSGFNFEMQSGDTIYVGGGSHIKFYFASQPYSHYAWLGFTDFYLDNWDYFTRDQQWLLSHIIDENDVQQITEAVEG